MTEKNVCKINFLVITFEISDLRNLIDDVRVLQNNRQQTTDPKGDAGRRPIRWDRKRKPSDANRQSVWKKNLKQIMDAISRKFHDDHVTFAFVTKIGIRTNKLIGNVKFRGSHRVAIHFHFNYFDVRFKN